MNVQHQELASGRWNQLSLVEQMANVGSEVERALLWKQKHNDLYSDKAVQRALELLDLTLNCPHKKSHYKEIARVREFLVDFFYGNNQFSFSAESWRKYFLPFAYAVRKST